MSKRAKIGIGMALGALWALAVVLIPGRGHQPFIPINLALIYALAPGGVLLMLMVARLAARRFFDDAIIDGDAFHPGSAAEIDQRVLTNTLEQLVLAAVLWPLVSTTLGAVTVIAMGMGFAIARVAFWVGYHISPPLRAFGFAATFYPTVFATCWTLLRLLT